MKSDKIDHVCENLLKTLLLLGHFRPKVPRFRYKSDSDGSDGSHDSDGFSEK